MGYIKVKKRGDGVKKRVALYVRVSTEGQAEEGYSIDAQKKLLEAWCISKEVEEYEFFIDPGFSGSNLERPALQDMMNCVRRGEISHVAVYKLDRLSRSQKDTLFLIEDVFNKYDVGFVSLTENMDTSTPIGRAMLGIISAFAQLERETIKIRTRMGMKERVKSGLWMGGGKIPFGYDYDSEKGILVPNDDAPTVRKIYDMFLSGMSPSAIANELNLKYEKLVVQILKRKTNIGVINYKGEEYEGRHEAIVDREIFDRSEDEFKRRARGMKSESRHLLSGLVYCGLCGARMRYQKWGKKGYKLVCYSQQKSKPYLVHDPECKNEKVWADEVEDELLKDIFSLSLEKEIKSEKVIKTQSQTVRLEKKLKRLYELWSDGNNALLDVIKDTEKKLERSKKADEERLLNEANKEKKVTAISEIENVRDLWDTLDFSEKRHLVRTVVDKILVFGDKINIYYRF
ncbi:MAG: recombinase family protein [Ruminococcaceae bacterium]|nr:recombinase family protein [Oscillospiraceae bacterium]